MQTMYKVVYVDVWGLKTSCTIKRGKLHTTYETDKWTAKRKYGPMVFKDKERAQVFMDANFPFSASRGYYEVWECDAEGARQCDFILPIDDVLDLNNETIRRHMDSMGKEGGPRREWAPRGSYMTSRIRLTRKVW